VKDVPASMAMRLRAVTSAPDRRGQLDRGLRRWLAKELAQADRRQVMQAGFSLARYDASAWIGTGVSINSMLDSSQPNSCN